MRIKNWKKFQHFKDRRPPWVKLHRDILDHRDIMSISACSFKILTCLWLLASEDENMEGRLPLISDISFRIRMSEVVIIEGLRELKPWVDNIDISLISQGYQSGLPETETETEVYKKETEVEEKTPVKMSLSRIRSLFREKVGQELGGGVNQELSIITQTYTTESIEFAILSTSTRSPMPTNPFMYFKKVLEGQNTQTGSEAYDPNKEYLPGSFFYALKQSEQGASDAI